jgi:hypothetical protein
VNLPSIKETVLVGYRGFGGVTLVLGILDIQAGLGGVGSYSPIEKQKV